MNIEQKLETITPMSIKITYFVHSTTKDNKKGLATGWQPGELSEIGVRQAKELGRLVSKKNFDLVFTSDLKRAVDSARLGFENKYEIIQDKRLREINFGDLTNTPKELFQPEIHSFINNPFPNGESYKDVEKRIMDFLKFLKSKYNGKHIAIISHEAPQLALDVLIGGKSWQQAMDENWRNTKSWQPGWKYEVI